MPQAIKVQSFPMLNNFPHLEHPVERRSFYGIVGPHLKHLPDDILKNSQFHGALYQKYKAKVSIFSLLVVKEYCLSIVRLRHNPPTIRGVPALPVTRKLVGTGEWKRILAGHKAIKRHPMVDLNMMPLKIRYQSFYRNRRPWEKQSKT